MDTLSMLKGVEMPKTIPVVGLFALLTITTNAALGQTESCPQIREQIQAQKGVLSKPDTMMLSKVGAHPECRFTSAEAYRAAWGDKPMPKDPPSESRRKKRGHDDD
jgi:hypothetical protein